MISGRGSSPVAGTLLPGFDGAGVGRGALRFFRSEGYGTHVILAAIALAILARPAVRRARWLR